MILSDKNIVEAIVKKQISIEPFKRENLTPNGYDLTIAEILIPEMDKKINHGKIKIGSMKWFVISTREYVKLRNFTAQLWIRSTFARKGIIGSFGKVDAGFEGTLTLSALNAGKEIEFSVGDRFVQIVFEQVSTQPDLLYHQRSGRWMGQRGIQL